MLANNESHFVYADAPRNVYWETTVACQLACQHCRAEAVPKRDPTELTTEEGKRVIDSVKALGSLLVLTGGDPLEREDLFELIAYARNLHVPVAVTPSTTPSLTRDKLNQLHDLGIATLGISLDGPTSEVHDHFRGVAGTFQHSMNALGWARELGVGVQINTTVTRATQPHLNALYELLASSASPPVRRWSLFLLIPTGRGSTLGALEAKEVDALFDWTYRISEHSPFHVSTVEAPHYRRHWIEQRMAAGMPAEAVFRQGGRMGFGIRDGNGVIFVARNGDVFPAGFLPYPKLGNVRELPLERIYRESPDLARLRDMDQLSGKCGRCTYRWLCGGSRARAWAITGDLLGDDPACAYQPPAAIQRVWPRSLQTQDELPGSP